MRSDNKIIAALIAVVLILCALIFVIWNRQKAENSNAENDTQSPSTVSETTTASPTTEAPKIESVVKTMECEIGPETHRFTYTYDWEAKTIDIEEEIVDWPGGWGDSYPFEYGNAIDGLVTTQMIREHPDLNLMLGNGFAGYPNALILAYNEWITSGQITTIRAHADSIAFSSQSQGEESERSSTTLKYDETFTFHVENGRLMSYSYTLQNQDYGETNTGTEYYVYNVDGTLQKVVPAEGSVFLDTLYFFYGEKSLSIATAEHRPTSNDYFYRNWSGTIQDGRAVDSVFIDQGQGLLDEPSYTYCYDSNGLLLSKNNEVYGPTIEYDSAGNILSINGLKFERMDVQI